MTEADIRRIVEEVLEETLGIKEDTSKVVIVPEKQYTFQDRVADFPVESMAFSEGETIVLTIDGITYTGKAKTLIVDGIPPAVYIGNLSMTGIGDDSGEPYFLMAQDGTSVSEGYLLFLGITDNAATHTVHAYKQTTVTTPISDKYLPGVCLPVVELSTTISFDATEPQALSTEDGTLIDAVVTKRNPFILALDTGEFAVSAVFNVSYIEAASMYMLSAFFETMRFELIKESGVWYFICYAQG